MADRDDQNMDALNVRANGPAGKRASAKGKAAMRRKMSDLGQTALSSPVVMPAVSQLAEQSALSHVDEQPDNGAVAPAVDPSLVETALASPAVDDGATEVSVEQIVASLVEADSIGEETAPVQQSAAEPVNVTPVSSPEFTVPPAASANEAEAPEVITTRTPTQSSVFSIKDMTMDMSANFNGFQGAMSEAQAKAQAAFEKSSSMLSEAGEFAKGNVEAMIESSKILADGVKGMGTSMVSESRTAFEAMTADVKELAAVKSPTDFFKLQSEMVRKNFDSAVAQSSKNTETLLKLMSDAFAPMSGRVSLAVEKARQVVPMNTAAVAPMTANV
jgi:phasin family protein